MFGWEGDSLQRAMDTCDNFDGIPTKCAALTVQDTDTMNRCKKGVQVDEVAEKQCEYLKQPLIAPWSLMTLLVKVIERLPGCNPLQAGPESATVVPNCDAPSTTIVERVPTGAPDLVIPPWPVCNPGPQSTFAAPFCDSIPQTTTVVGSQPTAAPAVITPL